MITASPRRVVITGMGVITPLGNTIEKLWHGLCNGRSGIQRLPLQGSSRPAFTYGGLATDFAGKIDDFGNVEGPQKKAIRKGLKLMCREIKMGVAAAQLAIQHSGLNLETIDPDRMGVVYGCDHIVTLPDEFVDAYHACVNGAAGFQFGEWGTTGLSQVTPLWLLKYLPNMAASHVAIYNDLRGPNNSLTYREPSANSAIGEAYTTICRGMADRMLAGATGSSVGPLRSLHAAIYTEMSLNGDDPTRAIRPFDKNRTGTVMGEGSAALILEDRELALARGATIFGEVLGHGSSVVLNRNSVANIRQAVANSARAALRQSKIEPADIGHVHAHGMATLHADKEEALAIRDILGDDTDRIPVTAAKSYFGNLGAGGGMVELISSLLAIQSGSLFPVLHFDTPDPDCPITVAESRMEAGDSVLNLNFSPNGQASALLVASNQA